MASLSVSAHDIDAAGVAVDIDLPPEWLAHELEDAHLEGAGPGHVSARLSRSGEGIVVRGRVRADLTTPCARCLGPAAVHVDTELSLFLKPAPAAAAPPRAHDAKKANGAAKAAHTEDEYEFGAAEADLDTYD